jgi:uncharacterized membrane protein YidH (DUF202 family)
LSIVLEVLAWMAALLALIGACVGLVFLVGGVSRYQARADASNKIQVYRRQIKVYAQKVKIATQEANIRYQRAIGIKKAQDEIQKTLSPLYVQFEYTQALLAIAQSGRNNSVLFVPTNPNGGLPTIVNPADFIPKHAAAPSK